MRSLILPAYRGFDASQMGGFNSATFVQVAGVSPTVAAHVSYSGLDSQAMTWATAWSRGAKQALLTAWYLENASGSGLIELQVEVRPDFQSIQTLYHTFAPSVGAPLPFARREEVGIVQLEGPFQLTFGRSETVVPNFNSSFRLICLELTAQ